MKFCLFLLIGFLISTSSFSQKLKDVNYWLYYIKPPKNAKIINRTYAWEVTELDYNEQMKKVETIYKSGKSNYGRGQFFASRDNLGFLTSFDPPGSGISFINDTVIPTCYIKMDVGAVNLMQVKPNSNGRSVADDMNSPPLLCYDVYIHVPLKLDMRYAENGEPTGGFVNGPQNIHFYPLYSLNESVDSFNRVYQFPKDFKLLQSTKGYASQGALDSEFNKHKWAFLKEKKQVIISDFVKRAKYEIISEFTTSKRSLPLILYYSKDKENLYSELENSTIKFEKVAELLKENIEKENKLNWFTPEIQIIIKDLKNTHVAFLNDTNKPYLIQSAAHFNLIWLSFFRTEFDFALSEIDFLEKLGEELLMKLKASADEKDKSKKLPKEIKKDYDETVNHIRYFNLDLVKSIILDFIPRYENNNAQLNWKIDP